VNESTRERTEMSNSAHPVPIPLVYTTLKDLHLTTELVKQGRANVTIITPAAGEYDRHGKRIQQAIEKRSAITVPVARDNSPAGTVPITSNLIVLGNRSTNETISELYNRYYTLLDLRYPGPEGYVLRSLHNPFGNGHNVIFVGGSDATGVAEATRRFIDRLDHADVDDRTLSIGWLMEIKLGKGIRIPQRLSDFEIWEACLERQSLGYFGWNSISKRMAMYYMTGDPFHAREAMRLAFPDAQAKKEIAELDGERIENKDEPLTGPYHYGAHMMILFWDLIEESPVFTDAQRLGVTNAFSKQFWHPEELGWRRPIYDNMVTGGRAYDQPPTSADSRHGQWSFVALYCLARYFQKDYPHSLWRHSLEAAKWSFSSLHQHAWVSGESDNLFWYNTEIEPIVTFMLLTGDRKPAENGVLEILLRGQDILVSGREPDWSLISASIGFLHKAAYLTQDGRYLEYLRRTGLDLDVFRLGQSFWPGPHLKPKPPADLVGKWSVHPVSEPLWRSRASGLAKEDSFQFASFRTAPDASGDFILIKGLNAMARNPYHSFAVLELRLAGQTVLEGYLNQVITQIDGMVEPKVAMDAALRYRDVIGQTAVAVAEVPHAAFCNWRRTLAQRLGRYALVVDDLTFRTASESMNVEILWHGLGLKNLWRRRSAPTGGWRAIPPGGAVRIDHPNTSFEIRISDPVKTVVENARAVMTWVGPVQKGGHKVFFSLIAPDTGGPDSPVVCARLADNAAALAIPQAAIAVVGHYEGLRGDLVVLGQDHLHALGLTEATLAATLVSADVPVQVDWDFPSGTIELVADRDTHIRLALVDTCELRIDGAIVDKSARPGLLDTFRIPAGRHTISHAKPDPHVLEKVTGRIETLLAQARNVRQSPAHDLAAPLRHSAPPLATIFTTDVGAGVTNLVTVPRAESTGIYAAEGATVHVLTDHGKTLRAAPTDGPIRVLRWWHEHDLLLAGCTDEKVVAFDPAGNRRWTFVSEMDPAVFRAAKTYWFKSAPGHEGIHGLHTGVFLDGKSQAFVGSACTLEILDENGELVKRLPVFWGPGAKFALIDGPDGSINLLVARCPSDMHTLAVINNRTLDTTPRSFWETQRGHTYVQAWGCSSRKYIFYEDLDAGGEKKVVGDVNGTWNRITIWRGDGTPLYNVNLAPAKDPVRVCMPPAENIRAMDIADLDGDGNKEILVAVADGFVIALDNRCRKHWASRMPSPPTVMKCTHVQGMPWIVAGCEDGTVIVLDANGLVLHTATVVGRPTCIEKLNQGVVLGTDQGQVTAFTQDRA